MKVKDNLQLVTISCDANLISHIARILRCSCICCSSAGIPIVTGTAALLVINKILSIVSSVYRWSLVVDSGSILTLKKICALISTHVSQTETIITYFCHPPYDDSICFYRCV